ESYYIMLKFVCLFALVAIACAAPRSYEYGDDENRDGVPDSLDANRDGKVDYGYGYARNGYGYGSYGYQAHGYGYVPYGDGYPYANVGPNGAVVKSPSGLIVGIRIRILNFFNIIDGKTVPC
ncbi:unnamed protein product, partial [Owenia fusiformis]